MDDNIIRLAALNDAEAEWLGDCIKGETGKPLPILANVLIGLRAQWPDTSTTTRCCAHPC